MHNKSITHHHLLKIKLKFYYLTELNEKNMYLTQLFKIFSDGDLKPLKTITNFQLINLDESMVDSQFLCAEQLICVKGADNQTDQ